MNKPKSVLILGSGGLKIGQAGEFDYSGSQAIKALKEEGIRTILINPNIATWQTSEGMAERVYFLPITPYFVERIIEKEQPDAIMLGFGGQTALNCGIELWKNGILNKHHVKVIGTPIRAINNTEDRELFVKCLDEINIKTARSFAVTNIDDAIRAGSEIGYPVMLRSAFALGGLGSGVAYDEKGLKEIAGKALSFLPQLLVEEYLEGWKEVEYEVVRDAYDNCITVCNMENFDPMGIHTGESIVVAPSQTLDNKEYHLLREVSIKVIKHLGIVGECNIQFALSPSSRDYRVIEVNARLSRSSALASKATGYPLAFVAAKLSLGYSLVEIRNMITKATSACFEPALDYVVVKMPRWDLQKFKKVDTKIGSEMKSVGEVMAIGRKFEEAVQKAIRMLNIDMNGVVQNRIKFNDLMKEIKYPTDKRIFAIAEALKNNITIEEIHDLSHIDNFFLHKIQNVIVLEKELAEKPLTKELMLKAKQHGFSDKQIALIKGISEEEARIIRTSFALKPSIKQIDTLAAEYPAKTNYLYLTYNGEENDILPSEKSVVVLGSGAYRIGSSVEFDWCCVNCIKTLKTLGRTTIMINFNPETVSTDYDECDRLYFDELNLEVVRDIYEFEQSQGVVVSMGGQIPNNLALPLQKNNVKLLGTDAANIDMAEDRHKFSRLLDSLGIDQPEWKELTNAHDARYFANTVGYPVLVRPSYVLSGAAMNVSYNDEDLEEYLEKASEVNPEHPVVISKFIQNAKEIEIDAVAGNGEILIYAIHEHVENAGVHSGDATMVLPAQKLYLETLRKIKRCTKEIAKALHITGPFNIQFIAKDNNIKVIECNLRASRSFPFSTKVFKKNFIEIATKSMMDIETEKIDKSLFEIDFVGVKFPQFSFSRLKGVDPVLSVEMASTGEVACFGDISEEAFLKAILSTGFELPKKNILISISGKEIRNKLLRHIKVLEELGFNLYATENTAHFCRENSIKATVLYKIHQQIEPNVITYLTNKKIDLVICMFDETLPVKKKDAAIIRRKAIEYNIPLINNQKLAELFIESLQKLKIKDLQIKAWDEYV